MSLQPCSQKTTPFTEFAHPAFRLFSAVCVLPCSGEPLPSSTVQPEFKIPLALDGWVAKESRGVCAKTEGSYMPYKGAQPNRKFHSGQETVCPNTSSLSHWLTSMDTIPSGSPPGYSLLTTDQKWKCKATSLCPVVSFPKGWALRIQTEQSSTTDFIESV